MDKLARLTLLLCRSLLALLGLAAGGSRAQAPAPTALPSNGQVTAGQASIGTSGSTMTVNQGSQRAVIQWDSFNVGRDAQVQFKQPNAQSATLNRVLDNNASHIAGRITSNGQVVISNPNGVLFAPGASADVGGLTATTHGISTADFMAGLNTWQRNGATGAVVNQGELRAAVGGYVALLAPEVRNEGVIVAHAGTVVLAAGEAIRLDFGANGQGLIGITATPSQVRALVENKHAVYAPGGLIVLSARAVNTLQGGVVRSSGTLSASSLVSQGGRIVLAGDDVQLPAGSRTEATGATRGGQIDIDAGRASIAGTLDVSGAQAGGSIRVQAAEQAQVAGALVAQGGGDIAIAVSNTGPGPGLVLQPGAALDATGAAGGGRVQLQAAGIEATQATVDASGDTGAGGQVTLASTRHVALQDSRVRADGASGGSVAIAASQGPLPAPQPLHHPTRHVALLGNSLISTSARRGRGGSITLTGRTLTLDGTTLLDATGTHGGGTVHVGGGWQGAGGLPQALDVAMGADARIDASALDSGHGGTLVLWSDVANAASLTTAAGQLRARGGAHGGHGGRIETSGHTVALDGLRVDAGANAGTGGLWYIDPADTTITQTIANGYAATLNTGTSVLNDVTGTITWGAGVTLTKTAGGDATLTLRTGHSALNDRDIHLGNAQIASTAGKLNLVLWTRYNNPGYSGRVTMDGASIATNGGHVWVGGGNATTWNGLAVGDGGTATWGGNVHGIYLRNTAVSTGTGDVSMYGISHYTGAVGGIVNFGVQLDLGTAITTTSGSIAITGSVIGKYDNGVGLLMGQAPTGSPTGGAVSVTSGSGAVALTGRATDDAAANGSNWRHALLMITQAAVDTVAVRSTSGAITVDGRATFNATGSTDASGVQLQAGGTGSHIDVVSGSGAIHFIAENNREGSQNLNALRLTAVDTANSIRLGFDGSAVYSGNLLIEANSILQRTNNAGAGSLSLRGTGTLAIAPRGSTFTQLRADSAGTLTFDNDWNFGTGWSSFTLGSATNTQALQLSHPLSVAGPIAVYGGDIAANANLTATASAAALLLKARGSITTGSNVALQANNGHVTLWADADGNSNGWIGLNSGTQINSANGSTVQASGGGHITLAGGTTADANGLPTGYAYAANGTGAWGSNPPSGVQIGAYLHNAGGGYANSAAFYSGGGNIVLRGKAADTVPGISWYAGSSGAQLMEAGNGTISLDGQGVGTGHGIELSYFIGGATVSPTLRSSSNAATAIMVNGNTTSTGHTGYQGAATLVASGSGGITVNGATAASALAAVGSELNLHAASGAIAVTGTGGTGLSLGGTWGRGTLPASSSNLTFTANAISIGTAAVNSSGTLTFESLGSTFTSALTLPSTLTFGSTLTGLAVGKATNTANVTLNSAASIAGPIAVHGGNIDVTANLTSTAAGGALLLKGTGNLTTSAGRTLQTNNGALTLWSDSDAGGGGHIVLGDNTTLNSANGATAQLAGGGRLTMAGGSAVDGNGLPTGFAHSTTVHGISLGTTGTGGVTLQSGGGDVLVKGRTTTTSNADVYHGLNAFAGLTLQGGNGAVVIAAESTDSYAIEFSRSGGAAATSITSSKASGTAIAITGTSTAAAAGHGVVFDFVTADRVLATGGGAIAITGTASGGGYGVWLQGTEVLASAGAITVDGGSGGINVQDASRLGKSTSGVTTSSSNITLTGDRLDLTAAATLDTTGAVTLQPSGTSFSGAQTYGANLALASSITGLALGKAGNTAAITNTVARTLAGPVAVHGGTITLNGGLNTTAGGADGDVLLKAASHIVQAAGVAVATNGGDVAYWADSDADTTTYGNIRLNAGSSIATSGGAITLGGGADIATGYATHKATGLGNSGGDTAGETGAGIELFDATLTAGAGSITLRGKALGTADDFTHGVAIRSDVSRKTISGGAVSITGLSDTPSNGGGNGSSNRGISIGSSDVTGSASVTLVGTGAAGTGGTAYNNRGVWLAGANISATGSGTVDITGTGRSAGASNDGVLLQSAATVTSDGGAIAITGTGSGAANGASHGINSGGTTIGDANSGAITLTGTRGATGASHSMVLDATTLGTAGYAGAIQLRGNDLSFSTASSLRTTGALAITPTGNAFDSAFTWSGAGATDFVGTGSITGLTLRSIASLGGLTIGKAASGSNANITMSSALGVAGPVALHGGNIAIDAAVSTGSNQTVTLHASGSVTDGASGAISTGQLLLDGGNVTLDGSSHAITTLAATGVGMLTYVDSNGLTLGTVGAVNGVSATGAVSIATLTGDLALAQNVATTSTGAAALVLNAGRSAAAGTAAGGNLTLANGVAATTGSGGNATLYSGAVAGSTGLAALAGAGSGRFRYGSDEVASNFTVALPSGLRVIYREAPVAAVAAVNETVTYGATPTLGLQVASGAGDTAAQVFSVLPTVAVGGATSGAGHATAGTHALTPSGGTLAGLGYASPSYTPGTLTVNTRTLTASYTGVARAYDGSTAASVTTGDDRLAADALAIARTATFNSKDAAGSVGITVSGVSLSGADAANYTVATTGAAAAAITPRVVNLNGSRVYDGSATAGAAMLATGALVGSETLALTGAGSFATRHAASGKAVSLGSLALANGSNGGLAANYTLAGGTHAATVTPAALSASTANVTRAYDGGTTAAGSAVVTAGQLFGSDALAGGSFAFSNRHAGTGKTVTVSGITVSDGNGGGNYTLTQVANTGSSITPAALTVSTSAVGKGYDGTTAASGSAIVAAGQLYGADALSGGSFAFADRHAGTGKTVTVGGVTLSDGNGGGNYSVSYAPNTASSITPAALTISTSAVSKSYDGSTIANGTAIVTAGQLFGADALSGGSFSFADRHAGSGKAVAVSGVAVGDGNGGGNYDVTYAAHLASSITPAALAVSVAPVSRAYDGTTAANGTAVVTGGQLFGSDALSGGSFAFTDRHAGSGKTVTVSGVGVADGNGGGNYTLTQVASNAGTITAAALTVSTADVTKAYDGTTAANGTAVVTAGQLFGSDALSGGSFSFADRHAGSGKTVTVGGVTVADGNGGANYAVAHVDNIASSITPAALTVSTSAVSKSYDGSTAASGTAIVTAGQLFGADALTGGSFAFADRHAGSSKTVTASGISVADGNGGGNYAVAHAANIASTITPAALTVAAGPVAKTYDGTTAANGTAVVTAGQLFGADALAGGSFAFADRHAGTGKAVTASGVTVADGNSGANYVVTQGTSTSGTITPATLTVSTADVSKAYDGSTAANGTAVVTAGQLFGSDALSGGSFTFADRHAGSGKAVAVSGVTVADGNGGANYAVAHVDNTASSVTPAALTVSTSAVNKTYDGSTAASGTAIVTAGQLFGADALTGGSFAFADRHAGSSKTVTASGISVADGNGGGNYAVAHAANTASTITPAALTVAAGPVAKTYDGTTAANGTAVVTAGQLFGADALAGGSFAFADRHAGTGKAVTASGVTVADGNSGANYVVTQGTSTSGTITPATLTVSTADVTKTYDGSTAANGTAVVTAGQLFGSDALSGGSFTFADRHAGSGKAVAVSGVTVADGNGGANYAVAHVDNTASSVTPAALTVSTSAVNKTYDGSTAASGTAIVTAGQLFGADALTGGSFAFADRHAGSSKTVTASGISVADGNGGGNYAVAHAANTASTITPAALTVAAGPVAKTYDGTTAANGTAVVTAGQLFGADALAGGSFAFADRHAGSNKAVNAAGITVADGNAGGNYTVTHATSTAGTITPAALTVSTSAVTKTYDGSTAANGTAIVTAGQLFGSDTLAGGSFAFTDADAGSAKTVAARGITVADGHGGADYAVTYAANTASTIERKPVDVTGLAVADKTYDGTAAAAVSHWGQALTGVGPETLVLVGTEARFADAQAGSGKTATASGYLLADGTGGGRAANYRLAGTTATAVATIDPAVLTVTANNDARFVVQADAAGFAGVSYSGFVHGETAATAQGLVAPGVTRSLQGPDGNAAGAPTLAGTYTGALIASGGSAANYRFAYLPGLYTIVGANALLVRTAPLATVYGQSGDYAVTSAAYYNGSQVMTLGGVTALGGNAFSVDDGAGGASRFTLAPVAAVRSGAGALAVGAYQLGAVDVANSNGANFSNTVTVVGQHGVSTQALTASASGGLSKVYDGSAAMAGVSLALDGQRAGDVVAASGSGSFHSRNAGQGLGYTVAQLALTGADAGNYHLQGNGAFSGSNGSITPRTLTVVYTGQDKVYDGQAGATVTAADDRIAGDVLAVNAQTRFADKNVGTAKPITIDQVALGGTDAGNYRIATTGTASASITRLASVTWTGGAGNDNWFDPANWQGGAVPDRGNVAQVVISQGATVTFGTTAVAPADSGTVQLDALRGGALAQTGGTLDVGGGGITLGGFTQSGGSIRVAGDLRVDGDFAQGGAGSITVAGNATLRDTQGGLTLGNLSVDGQLAVTSTGGDITQAAGTALAIGGASRFSASTDVRLTNAGNDFAGPVSLAGRDIAINDSRGDLQLADVAARGTLEATSSGAITQAAGSAVTVAGASRFTAAGDVQLDGPANDFTGAVSLSGRAVTVVDGRGGLVLGDVTASGALLARSTGGDLSQASGTALRVFGQAQLQAPGARVVLDPAAGNRFDTGLQTVDLAGNGTRPPLPPVVTPPATVQALPAPSTPPPPLALADAPQPSLAVGAAATPGATVTLVRTADAGQPGLVTVELPSGAASFSVALPERVTQGRTAGVDVRLADGSPLPDWLRYDAPTRRLVARSLPPGALPMRLAVSVDGQQTVVEVR